MDEYFKIGDFMLLSRKCVTRSRVKILSRPNSKRISKMSRMRLKPEFSISAIQGKAGVAAWAFNTTCFLRTASMSVRRAAMWMELG